MADLYIFRNPTEILYIGFIYDSTYFTLGTDIGFQAYQTFPMSLKLSRQFNGGIGLVKMLNKSNIFCLVGGGSSPMFSPNKLIIWDDKKLKVIFEIRFVSFILNCHLKEKCIFVICADTISLIDMKTLKIISTINTINNPRGISTISSEPDKYVFSFPDLTKGQINLVFFPEIENNNSIIIFNNNEKEEDKEDKEKKSLFDKRIKIKAHESNICSICLNNNGTKLATSSDRGTIVRVFETSKGEMINEFRRGSGDAIIYSISFSFDDNFLGLTSDHGTAHIFNLNKENQIENNNKNNVVNYINQNYLGDISKKIGIDTLFSLESSFAQFKIPHKEKTFITFSKENNSIFVIDKNSNYLAVELKESQEPKIIQQTKLFKI